jgi:hypothetical protein
VCLIEFQSRKKEKKKTKNHHFPFLRVNPPKIKKEIHFDGNNKCVFGQVRDRMALQNKMEKTAGNIPAAKYFQTRK